MTSSDEWQRLAEGLYGGDEGQWRLFWELHEPELLRRLEKRWAPWLAAREDPEDVLQSVFRTFLRRVQEGQLQLRDGEAVLHLLGRIALRKFFKKVRYHRADRRDARREAHTPEEDGLPDRVPSPEELVEQAELQEELRQAIDALEGKEKLVVEQALAGRPTEEIACALGISDSMTRRYMRQARARLERLLKDE
jgi:RNA polymerase sigma-70 factor (ECF subfamily)